MVISVEALPGYVPSTEGNAPGDLSWDERPLWANIPSWEPSAARPVVPWAYLTTRNRVNDLM